MWTILHAIETHPNPDCICIPCPNTEKKKLRPKGGKYYFTPGEKLHVYFGSLGGKKIIHASNPSKVHPPHKPSIIFYLFLPRFDIPEEKKKDHRLRLYPKIKPLALRSFTKIEIPTPKTVFTLHPNIPLILQR
jgi:hypothetical protein